MSRELPPGSINSILNKQRDCEEVVDELAENGALNTIDVRGRQANVTAMNRIECLREFYASCCVGNREHEYGERSEQDWVYCVVEDSIFRGRGGVRNLTEILARFKAFTLAKHGGT